MLIRIFVVLLCFSALDVSMASIRVLENSTKRFVFEWTTDNFHVSQKAGTPSSISFAGANLDLGDNGEAIVPAVSLNLGVPPKGGISIRLSQISSHNATFGAPLRTHNAPGTRPRFQGLHFSSPWISDAIYAQNGRMRCAQLILRPVVYRGQETSAEILDKAQITVEFPSASTAPASVQTHSDYTHMLQKLLLNYSVAAGWTAALPSAKRASVKTFPIQSAQSMIAFAVGDGHADLNEGTINENGMIMIRGSDIIRLLGPSQPTGQIALYASYKGELSNMTPPIDQIPDGMSEVPMMRFDLNNNGTVDSADYFLAYVSSISDWLFNTPLAPHRFSYQIDHYDDYRHYWITVKTGGAGFSLGKMGPIPAPVRDTLTSFENHLLLKKSIWPSLSQGSDGGLDWAWTNLTYFMPNFSIDNFTLPYADPTAACSVQVVTSRRIGSANLAVSSAGVLIGSACQYGGWFPFVYSPGSSLQLSSGAGKADTIELQQIEFRYMEKLDMTNQTSMTVFSPEDSGLVCYRVVGLPADLVYIMRIGNGDSSMSLVDTVRGGGAYQWTDTAGIGVRYFVCTQQAFASPRNPTLVSPRTGSTFTVRDLRNLTSSLDYLIVTHPNFMVQAQTLARHKKNVGRFSNPKVISISDIYNQFSGGNTDPSALRNCIEYVRAQIATQWNGSFDYVVLMGAGHYDYRNIANQDTSFMPVAEFDGKCLEDFFVYLDPGDTPDLTSAVPNCFLGRIPCRTVSDATAAVAKIIQMEDPSQGADFGAWRNRVLLVNDDDMQGNNVDPLLDQHLESSRIIDSIVEGLCPAVNVEKVNEFEYPWDAQREKPEAKQALLNGINNGAAIVNWFGHGAINVWADEHIFMAEDLGNLHNNGEYPLISAFSCSVGEFDQPSQRCLSEYCLLAPNSGAIATISATREAYASDNQKLASNFFCACFDTTDSAAQTMGEALMLAKQIGRDDNQKSYSFLGDPSLQLMRPARKIAITVSDNSGATLKDTLKALQQVTIHGAILKNTGSPDPQFGVGPKAMVQISMFNPPYITTRKDGGTASNPPYKMPGTPIFAGQAQISSGAFQQQILLPKNVTFNTPGIRITGYGWNTDSMAIGSNGAYIFHGFSSTKITDTVGPSISIRPVYQGATATVSQASSMSASFTDKISAPLPLTIQIIMFDSSGVDAVSTGPDEGITFEVPGVVTRTNINHNFQFAQGDFRRGTANWTFDAGSMVPGNYTINITAQDLLGNVAKRSVALQVTTAQQLALYHVFTYPNPMAMGSTCNFYFDLSQTIAQVEQDRVIASIRLFTLSGRLVRTFTDVSRGQPFDGRDAFGNRLSPGVYLYQITAEDPVQQTVVKSPIEKLAINPPR